MERAEAEAIYDSGRKACVEVLLALANQVERLDGRVERLEEEIRELRRDSDNSSLPPSADTRSGKQRRKGKRSDRTLAERPARGPIRRHQVAELPRIAVRVTEHRLCRRRCPDCGTITQAE